MRVMLTVDIMQHLRSWYIFGKQFRLTKLYALIVWVQQEGAEAVGDVVVG